MEYDAVRHHRRSIRLRGYDYSGAGAYFLTICTQDRADLLGEVMDGQMQMNEAGRIVAQCWQDIPLHFPHVRLDAFVVMPNHLHGILILDSVGARHAVPRQQPEQFGKAVPGSIPTIVRSFKSAATNRINEYRRTPGAPVWQRNYYEHIIRDEGSLNCIREYITSNPRRWAFDREHPHAVAARHAWPLPDDPWRT